jgi:hypothetical protein
VAVTPMEARSFPASSTLSENVVRNCSPLNSAGTIIPNHQLGGGNRTANITNNFYLSPVRSDPFGYSQSQLANAVFTGNMRAMSRT